MGEEAGSQPASSPPLPFPVSCGSRSNRFRFQLILTPELTRVRSGGAPTRVDGIRTPPGDALWPWTIAGDDGRAAVVWYQNLAGDPKNFYIYAAVTHNAYGTTVTCSDGSTREIPPRFTGRSPATRCSSNRWRRAQLDACGRSRPARRCVLVAESRGCKGCNRD